MTAFTQFKLWSSRSSKIKDSISKHMDWRGFNDLSSEERRTMLLHFNRADYFWGVKMRYTTNYFGDTVSTPNEVERGIGFAINSLNNIYKKECYGKFSLEELSYENVFKDFLSIFKNLDENVVYETLSFYGIYLIEDGHKKEVYRYQDESDEKYKLRKIAKQYEEFDAFAKALNEIFKDYKIDVYLARQGFISRQDNVILENIYVPVLEVLSDSRWEKTERDLSDAFHAFRKGTPDAYSECITHCYASVQAFLQELTGMPNARIKDANIEAQRKKKIPSDPFSKRVFVDLLSIFEQCRQKYGDAHSKDEYADEMTAQLVLNLTVVYLQHCLHSLN